MLITELQAHMEQYNTKGIIFLPANLYGYYDHFADLENSHVIPALINKFINAKENNLPEVHCYGDGSSTRDFVMASNICDAFLLGLEKNINSYDPVNLGSGSDISIKDLASLISELTKYNGKIVFTGEIGNGQKRRLLNTEKAKSLLNWLATTSLKDGLTKTINWYLENRPTA
jgi:nucleoside-diphosphate-sugar epimerase